MAKESYHQKAGRIGKSILEGSRYALGDIQSEIERLQDWSGEADKLAEIADNLKLRALKIAEETAVQAGKKIENKDVLQQVVQQAATVATLFHDQTARFVLAQDVQGYRAFSQHIESDSRVAAWRHMSDEELARIYADWQRADRTKVRD